MSRAFQARATVAKHHERDRTLRIGDGYQGIADDIRALPTTAMTESVLTQWMAEILHTLELVLQAPVRLQEHFLSAQILAHASSS